MADVQIAVIDQQNTQIALSAPSETEVTVAVPGVQGPVGEGVPSGGTTNQVLFKQSGTDYDTAWSEVTSAMIGDLEITNADVAASAEIAVSKLADGAARQLLQTDAAGTGVEWTSNVDVPGTLDVTGATTLDSTLTVPLGSAAAPTLRFTGDTNTGIYSPGADQVAISTNGTGRLFVDASGNVGIGSPSPGAQLEIRSPSNPKLVLVQTAIGSALIERTTNGAVITSAAGPANIRNIIFQTSDGVTNSERLRITSDGKLGLGTSSPSNLLHVNGIAEINTIGIRNASPTSPLHVVGSTTGQSTANAYTAVRIVGSSSVPPNGGGMSLGAYWNNVDINKRGAFIQSSQGIDAGSTARPLLLNPLGGSVGIGTTSPSYPLHIVSADNIVGMLESSDSTSGLYLKDPNGTSGIIHGDGLFRITADVNNEDAGSKIEFYVDGSEKAQIDSSGRLLVGTSSANGTGTLQVQRSRRLSAGGGRGWVEVVGCQSGFASGTVVDLATLTLASTFDLGSYVRLEVFAGVGDLLNGYTMAFSVREALVSCRSSTSQILVNTEDKNLQGSVNSGVGNITLATSIVASSAPSFTLRATPTITGSGAGAETATLTYRLSVLEGAASCTITNLLTS